MAMLRSIIKKS